MLKNRIKILDGKSGQRQKTEEREEGKARCEEREREEESYFTWQSQKLFVLISTVYFL